MLPWWHDGIVPDLRRVKCDRFGARQQPPCARETLDQIPDADIAELNIPTGIPLVYELDQSLKPVVPGGATLEMPRLPKRRLRPSRARRDNPYMRRST